MVSFTWQLKKNKLQIIINQMFLADDVTLLMSFPGPGV